MMILRRRTGAALLAALGCALLLVGYRLLARYAGWPGPGAIASTIQDQWSEGILRHDISVSSARWLIGWIPGAALGAILGLLTGRLSPVREVFEPLRLLLRSLPFIALVPVTIRLFGTSETGKVLLICWATCSLCWPVVDSTARAIPEAVTGRALTLGALPIDRLRVIWFETRAGIFSALRTSLALAWIVVATVEMAGVFQRSEGNFWSEGLGYRLFRAQEEGQDSLLLGALLVFALTGACGELLLLALWRMCLKVSLRRRSRGARRSVAQLTANEAEGISASPAKGHLVVQDLQASYAGARIFSDCSLDLQPGEILAVLGRSGAGKTTLLRCIAQLTGDDLQMYGTVLLDGRPARLDQRIGVVSQDALVFSSMLVWENLVFGRRARRQPAFAHDLLVRFGLAGLENRVAGTLSGGQLQRLALASSLANRPEVLLLDEPFGALDAVTRAQLRAQFHMIAADRLSCIFVTHDIDEAIEMATCRIMIGIGTSAKIANFKPAELSDSNAAYASLRRRLYNALVGADGEGATVSGPSSPPSR